MNSTTLKLVYIGFLLLIIVFCYVAFLRPMPMRETTGTVVSSTFKPAGKSFVYPYGANRGFRVQNSVETSAGYTFGIETPDVGNVSYFATELAAKNIHIGDRVKVTYQKRDIPFVWSRFWVFEIVPEKPPEPERLKIEAL